MVRGDGGGRRGGAFGVQVLGGEGRDQVRRVFGVCALCVGVGGLARGSARCGGGWDGFGVGKRG